MLNYMTLGFSGFKSECTFKIQVFKKSLLR